MRTCCRWFQGVQAATWGHFYSSGTSAPRDGRCCGKANQCCLLREGGREGALSRSWSNQCRVVQSWFTRSWFSVTVTFPSLFPLRCSTGNRISLWIHPLHPLSCPPLHAPAVSPLQDRQQRLQHPDRQRQWAGQSCSLPCSSHPSTTPQHQPDLQCRENR